MPSETLTITDNRTGKTYELPITHETIKATDLRQMKTDPSDFGLMPYDPSYMNTAACKSRITFIDGDKGILEYRGYPIDQLAEKASFLETAYLIWYGELPNAAQLAVWTAQYAAQPPVPEMVKRVIAAFDRKAHPMAMLISALGALSSVYPDAKKVGDPANRLSHAMRLLAQVPAISAYIYRHGQGLPMIDPDPKLSYAGNFHRMLFAKDNGPYTPDLVLEEALDILLILHADHEQNCSTSTMRLVGSSQADPYASMAAAAAALYGPLHGGANEAVLRMLEEIGSVDNIPGFITKVKAGEGRLMGFGHRVYKNYDPRAKIIKRTADQVFAVTGKNQKIDMAVLLEKIALEDEYFIKRKLYPNVDFYSGIIYQAMGFPTEMFTVLFAVGRAIGWLAQWEEMLCDGDQKIGRPRQIFLGPAKRDYVAIEQRG
ncbi:MAG: citrate synthase [Acidobacteria bacterium]|nr:citrate synthase [Acidobacteriota bacterium]